MSVQNTLKKPAFSRTIRGYSPEEVDRYIAYVNERYSAVCRESAELKRRLTRLMLGLDSVTSEKSEAKTPSQLTDDLLNSVTGELSEECRRHSDAIIRLLRSLSEDRAETHNCCSINKDANGVRWQASSESNSPSSAHSGITASDAGEKSGVTPNESEQLNNSTDSVSIRSGFASQYNEASSTDSATPFAPESDNSTAKQGSKDSPHLPQMPPASVSEIDGNVPEAADSEQTSQKTPEHGEKDHGASESTDSSETPELTPAQRAEALDFYPVGEDHNGENFDPMTLAAEATSHTRRNRYRKSSTEE